MCQICLDWEKEKLTAKEAMRNIGEAMLGGESQHLIDLAERIISKEVPLETTDAATDANWENEHREE
jgi:hypothetical protein